MQYMPAVLVAKAKEARDDGSIVEVVIWELSELLADFERDVNEWSTP